VLEATGGGKLVSPGDNRELAEALADLVLDSRARRELGHKAAEGVRRLFTVERMARETAAVLARLAKREPLREKETLQAGVLSN
ncbi:MAG: glycosyltransferase, partial [Vicinamibacteria bacterium]